MLGRHPRGLVYILFTEMWERVGFYTLMAILVLYMDRVLRWSDGRKGDVYGIFIALCYFVPLAGGAIGDRLLGQLRSVRIGAALMALGYAGLALSAPAQVASFYGGLLLVALGTGIFKVNISVLVGNLYADRPGQKDAGFNIFYMGVNVGAAIAPLLATFVSVVLHSYNISFWICAAGLVAAQFIFAAGRRHLAAADTRQPAARAAAPAAALPPGEARQRLQTLVILFLIVIFFWVAFYQNYFAMTLFAERSTRAYRLLRPETYQFFEPFYILLLTPPLLALMARLRRRGREPSTPAKIMLGMVIMCLAMGLMVAAALAGGDRDAGNMSPAWLIGTYFVVTLAEILISPMGQAYVSKVAPPRFQGLMMGGWFAAIAIGGYGSGFMGRYYSAFAHHAYFLLLCGLMALAVLLVALSLRRLRRFGG